MEKEKHDKKLEVYDRKYGRACIPTLTLFMHVNKKETATKRPNTQTNKNAVRITFPTDH